MTTGNDNFQIRLLEPEEFEHWDQFAEAAPGGTFFHMTRWAKIIRNVFGRDFQILALFKNETLQAGFLHWPKTIFAYRMITRAPVTPYQGFIFKPSTKAKSSGAIAANQTLSNLLIKHLLEKYHYIDIVSVPQQTDVRPFIWQGFSARPRYTYTFPLLPFGELKKKFSQALRRKIKNLSGGLQVEESQETAALLQFVMESYRYHGIEPPVVETHLQKLFLALSEQEWAHIFYLKKDGSAKAGLLLLEDANNVYALFAGVDSSARKVSYTEYLYTECMKDSRFSGKRFDFLGANTQDFEQFKRSFGGELQVHFELNYTRGKILSSLSTLRKKQTLFKRSSGRNA